MKNIHCFPAIALSVLPTSFVLGEEVRSPSPLMTQIHEPQYEDRFDAADVDKAVLVAKDETRWAVKDGVLLGRPTPVEYQRNKGGHNGASPLLQIRTTGPYFCMTFRVRFNGTGIAYQGVGFGISRYGSTVRLDALGTRLTADKGHLRLMHDPKHGLVAGKWYDCTFEILGDEIVVQFRDGPTLYGKHTTIYGKHGTPAEMAEQGIARPIFQIKGTRSGTVELDDVRIWSVKSQPAPKWPAARAKLSASYRKKHGGESDKLDRKVTSAALDSLAEKDPDWEAIQAARVAEAQIKQAGRAASKQRFDELTPEEQDAKRRRRAELIEKRRSAEAGE